MPGSSSTRRLLIPTSASGTRRGYERPAGLHGRPALRKGPRPRRLDNPAGQAHCGVCPFDALGALHDHVRAQGDSSARDPLGAEPSGPVRLAAVSRRRHQAVLQGGDAPRQRRQARVPDRPRYSGGACVRGLFDRAGRRDDHGRWLHDPPPAGRPFMGHPGHADGLQRHGLRGDVGRVGVRVEVPLDRSGPRQVHR